MATLTVVTISIKNSNPIGAFLKVKFVHFLVLTESKFFMKFKHLYCNHGCALSNQQI